QNTVNSPINGVPFVPGTLGVDTSTEEWNVYYSGGSYEGAAFKFYYKTPIPSPIFDLIAANLVELAYLLPILDVNWKRYHFQLCERDRRRIYCAPTFSPYGSFIVEDDVYWVGTGF